MAEDKKLRQLNYFVGHAWPIFPCHWVEDGHCSCGGNKCAPGKHPLTKNGFYAATLDFEQVKAWHEHYPLANWGMRTGAAEEGGAGIIVIDIDNKSGGFETWDMLREEHPEPLETVTSATGNGGQHLWFAYPPGVDIKSGAGVLGKGIDIRANAGYIIIPPSVTNNQYRFELNPDNTPLAELPGWILTALNGRVTHRIAGEIHQGERHQALVQVAGSMRRIGMPGDVIGASLRAVRDEKLSDGDHPVTDEEISEIAEWITTKSAEYPLTDLGNAERFIGLHGAEVRYCFNWEKWLSWDGRKWAVGDVAGIMRRAHETVRSIYIEASNTRDEEKRRVIASHALHSEARSRVENMVHSAKPYIELRPDELDKHPMLLNVKNGIVDLTTGELQPHKKEYLLTKIVDTEYHPEAECPKWEAFLNLITGNDAELQYFLQLAVGYTLTGRTDEHCLFFMYGGGQNGKSTFSECIRRMMGDYSQRVDIEALMQNWNLGTSANPHIASMAGARFVLASEIAENRKLNESLVKDLTGSDSITARFLFSNPFTFIPSHKLWLYGNHEPRVSGTDWGFWRRMRVIPFAVTIPEEVRRPMAEVLAEFDNEMPGILAWAVVGCLLWQKNGLEIAEAVKNATNAYRTEQDLVQQFLDEKCELHPEHTVDKDKLYTAWSNWCADAKEEQAGKRSKKWLTRQMTGRGFKPGGDGNRLLLGLKLL
jgi:putative DNA primase/helicase